MTHYVPLIIDDRTTANRVPDNRQAAAAGAAVGSHLQGAAMHIHGNHMNTQMMTSVASQGTQRAAEAKKAAAAVRRRLDHLTAAADSGDALAIDADSAPDPQKQKGSQPEPDSFEHFFSATA